MADGRTSTPKAATVTVDVREDLDLATVPALRRSVQELLTARPQTLVVDLSRCGFVGVDALGVLADLTTAARRQGTTLALVGVRSTLREVIALLGLGDRLLHGLPEARRSGRGAR